MEPSFLSIGPSHLAVGMNNRAWFYDLGNNNPELSHAKPDSSLQPPKFLFDKEYLGNISNISLNTEYASVLFEGQIFLHQVKRKEKLLVKPNRITMPLFVLYVTYIINEIIFTKLDRTRHVNKY